MNKIFIMLIGAGLILRATAQTYHEHDKEQLRKFLRQNSVIAGKTNGERIGLTVNDMANWYDDENWCNVKMNWTNGNDSTPKRLLSIPDFWSNAALAGILDLTGCDSLTQLHCSNGQLTALNVNGCNALKQLKCSNNQLATLNVNGCTALDTLDCDNNNLTTLDLTDNHALSTLHCIDNRFTKLNVSNNQNLTTLYCGTNRVNPLTYLTTLDLTNNEKLTTLFCSGNRLATLDLSHNTNLAELWCGSSQLTTLNLADNKKLNYLWCSNNQLKTLDLTNNHDLATLRCFSNQLTTLDLTNNLSLNSLQCFGNQLNSVTLGWNTPDVVPTSVADAFTPELVAHTILFVPAGSVNNYQDDYLWKNFKLILETGTTPPDTNYSLTVAPNSLEFIANGASKSLQITANVDWNISVSDDWIIPEKTAGSGNDNVAITVTNNLLTSTRSGVVTVSGANDVTPVNISITQDASSLNILPTSIALDQSNAIITTGATLQLVATVLPHNANNKNVDWISSDNSVADVHNGLVQAYAPGNATITATTSVGGFYATCLITVQETQGIVVQPSQPTDKQGAIDVSIPIPGNASFELAFDVTLPTAVTLDQQNSHIAADLQDQYQLSITPRSDGRWHFLIIRKPETLNAVPNNRVASNSRKIVNVAYTTIPDLPGGQHSAIISDLIASFSDGTTLQQKEIIVSIKTNSTGNQPVREDNVTVVINENVLTVDTPYKEKITGYAINGTRLLQVTKNKGVASFNLQQLPRGVIIVGGSSGWTRKLSR